MREGGLIPLPKALRWLSTYHELGGSWGLTKRLTMELSKQQEEILKLLLDDKLTPRQIAQIRGTSRQAVYKTIKKLKDAGVLKLGVYKGLTISNQGLSKSKIQPRKSPAKVYYRLHAQIFKIDLIYRSRAYETARAKGTEIIFKGNTVKLFRDCIMVYAAQDLWFEHPDKFRAFALSIQYWGRYFVQLGNHLNTFLVKERKHNIKEVRHELALVNDGIAKNCNDKGDKIRLYTREDGKLWFEIDKSYKLDESEFKKTETSIDDAQKFEKQIQDWRNYDPPTNSELARHMGGVLNLFRQQSEVNAATLIAVNELIKIMKEKQ